jgi:hypothetical protein
MPIPQPIDRKLGELDDLAAGILVALRVLRYNPKNDGKQVRGRLQTFNDAVVAVANELIANG